VVVLTVTWDAMLKLLQPLVIWTGKFSLDTNHSLGINWMLPEFDQPGGEQVAAWFPDAKV